MAWRPFQDNLFISGSYPDEKIMKQWHSTNKIKEITPIISGSIDRSKRVRYDSEGTKKG